MSDDGDELDRRLDHSWEEGRAAWPEVALPREEFFRHLQDCLPVDEDLGVWLGRVHVTDLYLAAGCARGIASALHAFDKAVLSKVGSFVSRIDSSPSFADEVRQVLRELLLVGVGGKPPKVAQYLGDGPLSHWIGKVARNAAESLRRNKDAQPHEPIDETTLDAILNVEGPELDLIKGELRLLLREALSVAFKSLTAKERNLLRLHYAGGLSREQIAQMLRVNRSTAHRRLERLHAALLGSVQHYLQTERKISAEDLDSIIGLVRSKLDWSLGALLRSDVPP